MKWKKPNQAGDVYAKVRRPVDSVRTRNFLVLGPIRIRKILSGYGIVFLAIIVPYLLDNGHTRTCFLRKSKKVYCAHPKNIIYYIFFYWRVVGSESGFGTMSTVRSGSIMNHF
jgi:hypothetical protein